MTYVFEPEVLHDIAKSVVGTPHDALFTTLIDRLDERYPGQIHKEIRWIFNTANGAMGALTLLYGSLREYLIIFGTPIGTEGHSGRYFADVHDFMIEGEMWTYFEGETQRTVYEPGDWAFLPKGRAKGYSVPESGWMLEYARGPIPTMLPMGLWDNLFSNLDMRSFWYTLKDYGRLTARGMLAGRF